VVMNKPADEIAIRSFKQQLTAYKQLIDDDITAYVKQNKKTTFQQFGAHARLAADAYTSILERGGKRIRGALVMAGYEMSGGTDKQMILEAARAIEMLHAYILIIDDIQDRSVVRRGGPTAHIMLSDYHRAHRLADDEHHFGVSIALNSALLGCHDAQVTLANLQVEPALREQVIKIVNETMIITAHGQTNDIMNEVRADVTAEDVDRVLEWKTAHYTFLNPLHVGMVLAGADKHALRAISAYAMHAGRAFQITDDILGIFGSEFESGKSPMDDLREGKRTILTLYAIEHAKRADKNFLIHMLGNQQLTQAEFQRCKDIIEESGAYAFARDQADMHVSKALKSLADDSNGWSESGVVFLRGLAEYLLVRSS